MEKQNKTPQIPPEMEYVFETCKILISGHENLKKKNIVNSHDTKITSIVQASIT